MLFYSQIFLLIFLPLVLIVYWRLAAHRRARVWILIVASLVFYGYWDLRLLPLLVVSVTVNWVFARIFRKRPLVVPLGVGLNLLILGVFKYADFMAGTLAVLFGADHTPWSIVLPLGISFFTFQQISYLVDLRRGEAPVYRFEDFALYVTFFPQLIAGPIVRHHEIIPQYDLSPFRNGTFERASRGLVLLTCGIVKKTLFADELAKTSDLVFARAAEGLAVGPIECWTAVMAFSLQIYFDFSGYSDMAIGLALLFGLSLPFNFNAPYRAFSIRDFWRRWHMTLSRFLRDYLYIPLGGSRYGPVQTVVAITLTMLLGGLWHGAAWTFVAWGGAHALAIMVNHQWRRLGLDMPSPVAWIATFGFVSLAWALFRATDFASAWTLYAGLFGLQTSAAGAGNITEDWWLIVVGLTMALVGPTSQRLCLEVVTPTRSLALVSGVVLAVCIIFGSGWTQNEFIYFQF